MIRFAPRAVALDEQLELLADEVHVWSVALDREAAADTALAILSPDERERAARFYFDRDRRRYARARGALRELLGRYLDRDARGLAFSYGPHGKPVLAGGGPALSFNVSHSGEIALIAIARATTLGVDVEMIRPMPDAEDIASRFFSPREVAQLLALPAAMRNRAFFTCWTRKEAYLKALGSGLARPLDEFDVTFAPGEAPRLTVPGQASEGERWHLHDLSPADGYAAALVVDGPARVHTAAWIEPALLEWV